MQLTPLDRVPSWRMPAGDSAAVAAPSSTAAAVARSVAVVTSAQSNDTDGNALQGGNPRNAPNTQAAALVNAQANRAGPSVITSGRVAQAAAGLLPAEADDRSAAPLLGADKAQAGVTVDAVSESASSRASPSGLGSANDKAPPGQTESARQSADSGAFAALARSDAAADAKAQAQAAAREQVKAEAERKAAAEPPKEPISKQLIDFIRTVWQAGARAVPDPSDKPGAAGVGTGPSELAPRLVPVVGFVAPVALPEPKPVAEVAAEPVYSDPRK